MESAALTTESVRDALTTLFREIVDGANPEGAYILNRNDVGLLRSLDVLSAEEASTNRDGGATIAAHADHVRYGLSLLNQWAGGEANPWATADWSESWKISTVDAAEWTRIRNSLCGEAAAWANQLGVTREVNAIELNGILASIAHTAYHLGAIRQIDAGARGPREEDGRMADG